MPRKGHIKRFIILFGLFGIFITNSLFFIAQAADDIILITHVDTPVDKLNTADIKRLFEGKIRMWKNGDLVVLVQLKDDIIQESFLKKYIRKSPSQFQNYWKNKMFQGETHNFPRRFHNKTQLINFIKKTKGAIGYIPSETIPEGVKIIKVD